MRPLFNFYTIIAVASFGVYGASIVNLIARDVSRATCLASAYVVTSVGMVYNNYNVGLITVWVYTAMTLFSAVVDIMGNWDEAENGTPTYLKVSQSIRDLTVGAGGAIYFAFTATKNITGIAVSRNNRRTSNRTTHFSHINRKGSRTHFLDKFR